MVGVELWYDIAIADEGEAVGLLFAVNGIVVGLGRMKSANGMLNDIGIVRTYV